jgi:hypothetical protein
MVATAAVVEVAAAGQYGDVHSALRCQLVESLKLQRCPAAGGWWEDMKSVCLVQHGWSH